MSWIKMSHDLDRKPEVRQIAEETGLLEFHVIGCLWKIWSWFDEQTEDGRVEFPQSPKSVTRDMRDKVTACVTRLDRDVHHSGFCQAMVNAGWMEIGEDFLAVPHFERNHGNSSKRRIQAAERKRKQRAKAKTEKPQSPKSVTRDMRDQRREEKSTHSSECVAPAHTEEFRDVVARHVATLNHGTQHFTSVSIANAWLRSYGDNLPPPDWTLLVQQWAEDAIRTPELHRIDPKPKPSRINGAPTEDEVVAHAKANGWPESSARKFWRHYETKDWTVFSPRHWQLQLVSWVEGDAQKAGTRPVQKKRIGMGSATGPTLSEADKAFLRSQNMDPDKPRSEWDASDEGAYRELLDWRREQKQRAQLNA